MQHLSLLSELDHWSLERLLVAVMHSPGLSAYGQQELLPAAEPLVSHQALLLEVSGS